MKEKLEMRDEFLNQLKLVIEFRKEMITLTQQILEKSEFKKENEEEIQFLINEIMAEFSKRNVNYDDNDLALLRNTLKNTFENQIIYSRAANKIRNLKGNKNIIDKFSKLE